MSSARGAPLPSREELCMRTHPWYLAALLGAVVVVVIPGSAHAVSLGVVKPVMGCTDLLKVDFSYLEDAPTKLDSATVVDASSTVPSQQCVVTGYVAPEDRFSVRMPTQS